MDTIKQNLEKFLRWSERYTQTDMVYLTHSGFWVLLGDGGLFFISFIMMLAFANLLPQESYGVYQYILAILGLFGIFSLPGLNTALVRSIAKKKEGSLLLFLKTKLKWSVLGSMGMLILAGWYYLHNQQLLAAALLIGGAFLPFYRTFTIFEAYWYGKKRFDIRSKYAVLAAVLSTGFLIPAIYFTNNILVILFALVTSSVLFEGFFFWRTLRQTKNKSEDKKDIKFGKNLTAISTIAIIAANIDKVILWKFLGPIQVAIYVFALLPLQKILSLNPIGTLALPKISESGIRKSLLKKFVMGFAVSIPAAVILVVSARFVYSIFFPGYMDSVIYFQVLSIWVALSPFALLHIALVAEAREKELYTIIVVQSIGKIVFYIALVPFFGIWGAIIGLLGGEIIGNMLRLYFFIKITSRQTTQW